MRNPGRAPRCSFFVQKLVRRLEDADGEASVGTMRGVNRSGASRHEVSGGANPLLVDQAALQDERLFDPQMAMPRQAGAGRESV